MICMCSFDKDINANIRSPLKPVNKNVGEVGQSRAKRKRKGEEGTKERRDGRNLSAIDFERGKKMTIAICSKMHALSVVLTSTLSSARGLCTHCLLPLLLPLSCLIGTRRSSWIGSCGLFQG